LEDWGVGRQKGTIRMDAIKKEHRLEVLENTSLRRIFGP
jgi:hypothetical protein